MASNLFSDDHKEVKHGGYSDDIKKALRDLKEYFGDKSEVVLIEGNKEYFLIKCTLKVSFPSRGPVNGIKIGEEEPIFLFINKKNFPEEAPLVYSDRKDFPSATLPHLNPVPKGTPANFCLHRGNFNDWFAEHNIVDLVERVQKWLNDAVANKLIRKDDEFEFTRVDDKGGFIIYTYDILIGLMHANYKANSNKSGTEFFLCEYLLNDKDPMKKEGQFIIKLNLYLSEIIKKGEIYKLIEDVKVINANEGENKNQIGFISFPSEDKVFGEYFTEFPDTYSEFVKWGEENRFSLKSAFEQYFKAGYNLTRGIPFSLVIKRPKKVLNHPSCYEILNFIVFTDDKYINKETKELLPETPIYPLGHKFPLTKEKAIELSGESRESKGSTILMVGSGALGSKIAMHLLRGGYDNITFMDSDELSPHNLVRHSLTSNYLGKNKAEALMNEAKGIFYTDHDFKVDFIAAKLIQYVKAGNSLDKFKVIVDATASSSVFNFLSSHTLRDDQCVIRCELTNKGFWGICYVEGKKRANRIDDLQMHLFNSSLKDKTISDWLVKSNEDRAKLTSNNEEIMVGMGCNSDTITLSDDVISFHAATMARMIKEHLQKPNDIGYLFNSKAARSIAEESFSTQKIIVPKYEQIKFKNAADWVLRINSDFYEIFFQKLRAAAPNEIGGILIGRINPKNKVVHVTALLDAPPDSIGTPYSFVRGVEGLPASIDKIQHDSGSLINYVGEWHTHPGGGVKTSETDMDAVNKLLHYFEPLNYPVFLLIVTADKITPYLFGTRD